MTSRSSSPSVLAPETPGKFPDAMSLRDTIEITTPAPTDVDAVLTLWQRLVVSQRAFGTSLLAEENTSTARDWLLNLHIGDGIRIATLDGTAVGFVTFALETDRFERDRTTGIVHNLYVDTAYRGQGIGTALLERAEDILAERGADRVRLEVMGANERASRFYTERGYTPHRVTLAKSVQKTDKANAPDRE